MRPFLAFVLTGIFKGVGEERKCAQHRWKWCANLTFTGSQTLAGTPRKLLHPSPVSGPLEDLWSLFYSTIKPTLEPLVTIPPPLVIVSGPADRPLSKEYWTLLTLPALCPVAKGPQLRAEGAHDVHLHFLSTSRPLFSLPLPSSPPSPPSPLHAAALASSLCLRTRRSAPPAGERSTWARSGIWGSRDPGGAVCRRAAAGGSRGPRERQPCREPRACGGARARGAGRDCGAAGDRNGPGRVRAAGRARALQEAPPAPPRLSLLFEKGKGKAGNSDSGRSRAPRPVSQPASKAAVCDPLSPVGRCAPPAAAL